MRYDISIVNPLDDELAFPGNQFPENNDEKQEEVADSVESRCALGCSSGQRRNARRVIAAAIQACIFELAQFETGTDKKNPQGKYNFAGKLIHNSGSRRDFVKRRWKVHWEKENEIIWPGSRTLCNLAGTNSGQIALEPLFNPSNFTTAGHHKGT